MGAVSTRRGRPRRADARRHPSGQIIQADKISLDETPDEIQATVLAYRKKWNIPESTEDLRNPLQGTAVGRLYLSGVLSREQYQAAQVYHRRAVAYAKQEGFRPYTTKGIDLGTRRVVEPAPEPDQNSYPDETEIEREARIRRQYADLKRQLLDLEKSATYRGAIRALDDLILADLQAWDPATTGLIRSGLNVIARLLRIESR